MGSQSQLNYLPESKPTLSLQHWRGIWFAGNLFILMVYLMICLFILRISYRSNPVFQD